MGTPEFAVPSLKIIHDVGFNILAVVTAPDKPAGRGLKLRHSPVKRFAVEHQIPVLQPEKLKHPDFLHYLESLKTDLQVVVAFRLLPEIVWNMPLLGTINLHASLLPDYRGAAPINWALINGEKITGVTTFFLKHEVDTGDIILQHKINIEDSDNAGTLHDKLSRAGAGLLLQTVNLIEDGNYKTTPQNKISDKKAPKIFREQCLINWNNDAGTIVNFIRGLSPHPGAYTFFNEKILKVYLAHVENMEHSEIPGKFFTDGKTWLKFAAKNGFVHVDEMQLEGKKKMSIKDFIHGYSIK